MKYNFDDLGWVEFEELIQVLLNARCGLGVESWGGNGDFGRDAYYPSELRYPLNEKCAGPFVFQCKFVSMANAAGAKTREPILSAVHSECSRISKRLASTKHLTRWTEPRHYALITNAPLSAALRRDIEAKLRTVLPSATIHSHGVQDISNWLALTNGIVQRFPQLFTIRDLTSLLNDIVHHDVLSRSKIAIAMGREESRVFVPTSAYYDALQKLSTFGFVILEGPPEMGKTTIARAIALAQLSGGWEAIECRTPKEFHKIYDKDRAQVFIADDFFGRTEYDPTRISKWQDELPYILRCLDSTHWLILTSRAHLLTMGKHELDVSGHNSSFPKMGEVIVNAGKLSRLEKAKIVYRHAKVAKLPANLRQAVKYSAEAIVNHRQFTPLRIKNLIASIATRGLQK